MRLIAALAVVVSVAAWGQVTEVVLDDGHDVPPVVVPPTELV